ncbi:MAG: HAD-IB family hydrolase [Pseudomonadales bacterium]|nr:HAD-IB family hydrolase [Pseudomonadales bacterium]
MRIALFDLDGTITYRDTLVPFILGWLRERRLGGIRLLRATPAVLHYAFDHDRGRLKGDLLHATLGGTSRSDLEGWAERFARATVASQVMPGAREAIDRHRLAGDRLVLMSASVDCYVPRVAALLGFANVICTPVLWDGDKLDGRLAGPNCRGDEKARQLRSLQERHPRAEIVAYGNSMSDVPHLCLAARGVFVNAPPRARSRLIRRGLICENWRRPR